MPPPGSAPPAFRVAFDARMIRHSGIGAHIRGILEALAAEESAAAAGGEKQEPCARWEIAVLGTPARIRGALGDEALARMAIREFNAPVYSLREQAEAPRHLRAQKRDWTQKDMSGQEIPAIVHWPHYNFPLAWRGPLAVTVHDLIHIEHPARRGAAAYQAFFLRALRRRLRRADRGAGTPALALTVSRHVKVLLQRVWGFPPHRVRVIGNGVNAIFRPPCDANELRREVEAARRDLELPARYWMTVGIDKPHKRLGWWLGEAERLTAVGEFADVGLVFAGTNGRSLPGISDRCVCVMPALPEERLRALYWGAEALVFPSLAEGFGLPVAEAMACGTPVVCSRRAPLTEIARGAAWFFEPDCSEELAARLREVHSAEQENENLPSRWRAFLAGGPVATPGSKEAIGIENARRLRWEDVARRVWRAWLDLAAEARKKDNSIFL